MANPTNRGDGRIAAWRGARNLALLIVLFRCLRALRLALHPAEPGFQNDPLSFSVS